MVQSHSAGRRVLSVLGGLLLLIAITLGTHALCAKVFQLTVVHGTSMLPTYRSGDLLLTAPQATYRVGDVVAYHPAGLPCSGCNVVHRIARGSAAHGWVTQGDNNPNIDPWLPKNAEILGKVAVHVAVPRALQVLYQPLLWVSLACGLVSAWLALKVRREA